jgi:hypothetical protein
MYDTPNVCSALRSIAPCPVRLLNEILGPLQKAGLLATGASSDHNVPGCAPASITPWPLLQALRCHGDQILGSLSALYDPLTARLMAQREAM